MNDHDATLNRIADLFALALDAEINDKQFEELKHLLKTNQSARQYYYQLVNLEVTMRDQAEAQQKLADLPYDEAMWSDLLRYEQQAPALIADQETKPELIQKVVYPKRSYKISKFTLFSAIASVAAILLLVIFVKVVPPTPAKVAIGDLTDSINAKWTHQNQMFAAQQPIFPNEILALSAGIVTIETNRGVALTIEGPAEFEFTRDADLHLVHGNIYARVSPQGKGFAVNTSNTKIIDLGTEFGIQANANGSSELHVIKGKTTLITQSQSTPVLQDQACKVSSDGSQVIPIPVDPHAFARSINSDSGCIWRGERSLSLADIVGGGNGRSNTPPGRGYHPATGKFSAMVDAYSYDYETVQQHPYMTIANNPYIDGVFVPDGRYGPVRLNSAGIQTSTIESTSGQSHFHIANGPSRIGTNERTFFRKYLELNAVAYGTEDNPGIYMLSNCGITFDLDTIRNDFNMLSITNFQAVCGVPDQVKTTAVKRETMSLNVRMFIDDRLCFEQLNTNTKTATTDVDIPLTEMDRFLTLVVTDADGDIQTDWCIWGNPVLLMKERQ